MAENRDAAMVKRAGGTVARKEFGADEIATTGETAGSVLAAQSRAMVEARFIMAMRNPRDWDDVRLKLLRACERPGFATGTLDPGERDPKKAKGAAWYDKPVGEGVQGFSIRFAEEAMRCMGNLDVQTVTIYDDDYKRLLTVVVTDLEGNNSLPTSIVIEKTTERKKRTSAEPLYTRENSYGDPLYIYPATEDQVFQKQQSAISKAMRNGILRLLPGDIQAECRKRILEIRHGDAAKDPNKVRREVSDAFGRLNVLPSGLKQYLDHDLGEATPAELAELRNLYKAIEKGDTTWHDALAAVLAERDEEPPPPGDAGNGAKAEGEDLTSKLNRTRQSRAPVATPAQTSTEPVSESATSNEEPKEDTEVQAPEPADDGGMSSEDDLRAEAQSLYDRLQKTVGKKGQSTAALKKLGVATVKELDVKQLPEAVSVFTDLKNS